jgi:outer membrane protein assembly factor BamB
MKRTLLLSFVAVLLGATLAAEDWPQWGGPRRNFTSEARELAASWPAAGPKQLWSRPLGDGYSGIAVAAGKLYTMYREGGASGKDVVVALDAATGKALWEVRNDAPHNSAMKMENGPGPHATPLVLGNRVYTVGVMGVLQCLDTQTGKRLWSHDLYAEYSAPVRGRGYSSSPMAYKGTIILPVGGPGQTLMAWNQDDGKLVWRGGDVDWGPSSPMIIDVDGQEQVVGANEVAGFDARNGRLLWTHPHKTQYGLNIVTPVWGEGNILLISSAYNGGTRALRLTRAADKTAVQELWFNNRMRVHFGTIIRIGDYAYGSSGDFGPGFLAAINVKTGEIAWQDRSFAKANFVLADGKLVIVDEDGNVGLATVSPAGMKVLAKAPLLQHNAWTVPSLAGTRLYVRDRKSILALDLK